MSVHLKVNLCAIFIYSIHLYVALSKRRYNKILMVFSSEKWSYKQYLFISVFFLNLIISKLIDQLKKSNMHRSL